jgi:hypothetical protein
MINSKQHSSCQLSSGSMKIRQTQAGFVQTIYPLIVIKNKKQKEKKKQRKIKNFTPKEMSKNNDLN